MAQEGSVMDSKPGYPLSARTPDNVERVRDAMLQSQFGSKLSLFTQTNAEFAEFSTRICIAIRMKSKSLKNLVNVTRWANYSFAIFLDLVQNNSDIANALLMSDEAHFHVSGYVNKQNCYYWAPNNPHGLHQCPLHSAKVIVWCAVSTHGIILWERRGTYRNCECRPVQ